MIHTNRKEKGPQNDCNDLGLPKHIKSGLSVPVVAMSHRKETKDNFSSKHALSPTMSNPLRNFQPSNTNSVSMASFINFPSKITPAFNAAPVRNFNPSQKRL